MVNILVFIYLLANYVGLVRTEQEAEPGLQAKIWGVSLKQGVKKTFHRNTSDKNIYLLYFCTF